MRPWRANREREIVESADVGVVPAKQLFAVERLCEDARFSLRRGPCRRIA